MVIDNGKMPLFTAREQNPKERWCDFLRLYRMFMQEKGFELALIILYQPFLDQLWEEGLILSILKDSFAIHFRMH